MSSSNITSNVNPLERGGGKNVLYESTIDILLSDSNFTDLLVESGQPILMRRSGANWTEVLGADGKPVVIDHDTIIEFLNGMYTDPIEPGRKPKWVYDLNEYGSLHPAVNLSREDKNGKWQTVRVRCAVQKQCMGETLGIVMRSLRPIPDSLESLGLPIQVSKMLRENSSGLIIVTGPTGSGKSTTLAGMVNEINKSKSCNIITIEDPVEFLHDRKKSAINHREIGIDVSTYHNGIRDALRFVPDVILIGEIRDAETMSAALRAGESGHLVLTTMHAPTCLSAIQKILAYFDNSNADAQVLSTSLAGIIAQALIKGIDGDKNHLAYEVLNCRLPEVANAIVKSTTDKSAAEFLKLDSAINSENMKDTLPMMKSLQELVRSGKVDANIAANFAVSAEDKAKLKGMGKVGVNNLIRK
jgi:pilus retraction protein PilT